jgi:hypothetical protein
MERIKTYPTLSPPRLFENPHIYEDYTFPIKYLFTYNSGEYPNSWRENLEYAKQKIVFHPIDDSIYQHPLESEDVRGFIILDFHDVFDSDSITFIRQCSDWNRHGLEVHVCFFVERGSHVHSSILAYFEDPVVQSVIKSLIVVFNRKNVKRGKGIVVEKFLNKSSDRPVYFVDNDVKNLENVFKVTQNKYKNLHSFHYVAVPITKCVKTPPHSKRIESFEELVSNI